VDVNGVGNEATRYVRVAQLEVPNGRAVENGELVNILNWNTTCSSIAPMSLSLRETPDGVAYLQRDAYYPGIGSEAAYPVSVRAFPDASLVPGYRIVAVASASNFDSSYLGIDVSTGQVHSISDAAKKIDYESEQWGLNKQIDIIVEAYVRSAADFTDQNFGSIQCPTTVSITNMNEAPIWRETATVTYGRNKTECTNCLNSIVEPAFSANVFDPDAGDELKFTLVSQDPAYSEGGTATKWGISECSGQLFVADPSTAIVYSDHTQYDFVVNVADSSNEQVTRSLTVTIKDKNDAPQFVYTGGKTSFAVEIPENSPTCTNTEANPCSDPLALAIGDAISAMDEEASASLAWVVVDPSNTFTFKTGTQQILHINNVVDFESFPAGKNYFDLELSATDSGFPGSDQDKLVSRTTVRVTITDVNDAPTIGNAVRFIDENAAENAPLTDSSGVAQPVTGSDEDQSAQILTYSVSGNSNFIVDSATGQIRANANAAIDYETAISQTVNITVSDGSLSTTAVVTIRINPVNEDPTFAAQTLSVAEITLTSEVPTTGWPVGNINAADTDVPSQQLTYSILKEGGVECPGDAAGGCCIKFCVNSGSANLGTLTAKFGTALDFEDVNSYSLEVQVQDSGNPRKSVSAIVTVDVTDVNEAPVLSDATVADMSILSPDIAEGCGYKSGSNDAQTAPMSDADKVACSNANEVVLVGGYASDPEGNAMTYALATPPTPSDKFVLNTATGELAIAAENKLNYESSTTEVVNIRVSDIADNFLDVRVTVNVVNVNEPAVLFWDNVDKAFVDRLLKGYSSPPPPSGM